MPYVDTVEQAMLDHFLTDPAYVPPTTLHLGLSSTTPTDAGGNITEPSGGAYARIPTSAADWGAATGTAPATKSNTATKTFPTATANWVGGANLTHWFIADALTAGNVLAWGPLGTAKPVLSGDTPNFPAASLVLKQGKPTDTF